MENEAITQVVETEVCPNAEELVPLTEEQADALGSLKRGKEFRQSASIAGRWRGRRATSF